MFTNFEQIAGNDAVIAAFGKWPSFHDAEVVSIHLKREAENHHPGPKLVMEVFAFRLEVHPDEPNRNDSLVTLSFEDVEGLDLRDFNHQNAINGLKLEETFSKPLNCKQFRVTIVQGFGLEAEFLCRTISVVSVKPYTQPDYLR